MLAPGDCWWNLFIGWLALYLFCSQQAPLVVVRHVPAVHCQLELVCVHIMKLHYSRLYFKKKECHYLTFRLLDTWLSLCFLYFLLVHTKPAVKQHGGCYYSFSKCTHCLGSFTVAFPRVCHLCAECKLMPPVGQRGCDTKTCCRLFGAYRTFWATVVHLCIVSWHAFWGTCAGCCVI